MPTSSNVVRPDSVDALAAVLKSAHDDGAIVAVRGAGTKSGWPAPSAPADLLVDMTGLDQVVDHASGDLVVTVHAGVRLTALQEQLRRADQWLALDPPEAEATVGGIVASAASGPRRLLYGTPRDLLIGITVVLADGTVAHSGGKVVKNVAGYDLGKLFTGSFGTLGVIAAGTFRLHPAAPARRVVRSRVERPGAAALAIKRCGAVPAAIEWDGDALTTVVECLEPAAEQQAQAVMGLVGGEIGETLPAGFGQRPWLARRIGLKLTHRIGALDDVLHLIGERVPDPVVAAHAGSGVTWVGYDGDGSEVTRLREDVSVLDGQVVVVHAPTDVKRSLDVWGPARGIEVMRRIKEQFDPGGRMAPGTFVGGI